MEPIAVIGLGCLFPGADSPDAFWQNLVDARDTTSLATREQMGIDPALLLDESPGSRDRYATLRGGFVHGFRLDPAGLRLDEARLAALDPVFEWTLHVARAALVDASYEADAEMLLRTGLVLGNLCFPTRSSQHLLTPLYERAVEAGLAGKLGLHGVSLAHVGGGDSVENLLGVGRPAVVASEALGLGGPRFSIDAACASSLYALRLACDRLARHEADLMLAGAVSRADPLFIQMGFSIFRAYPERGGESRPLDARSAGLVSGEGAGMIALRRYSDAVRDGDRVLAVICGIGLSNDGAGKHLLVPNEKGQRAAMQRAYADAGCAPASVAYVECHATGTPIGDPTELESIEAVFGADGDETPMIGSVKSNFGHLLSAAGMASLIKAILALRHGVIPPTIGVRTPLASGTGRTGGDRVVRDVTSWPEGHDRPRRAGVSAFGFGGTNAHVVLEEHPGTVRSVGRSPGVPAAEPLAIVGMAAQLGESRDLRELDRASYDGRAMKRRPPSGRWNGLELRPDLLAACELPSPPPVGAYMHAFELDFLRAGVPPDSGDRPIAQQLLLLDVADRAIRDAGLERGTNVGVVVAIESELELHRFRGRVDLDWQVPQLLDQLGLTLSDEERAGIVEGAKDAIHGAADVNQYVSFIGNVIACRVASRWDFSGPAFTVSAGEMSAFRALEIARDLLGFDDLDAVVLGGVDLAGSLEAVAARWWVDPDGTARVGEGAAAIVLQRAAVAGARVHAIVESVVISSPSPGRDTVRDAAERALDGARIRPEAIGYLELGGSGIAKRDGLELRGLSSVYASQEGDNAATCAIGSVAHVVGDVRAASGLAGLVHATLCLEGRHLPPALVIPDAGLLAGTLWYTPDRARPWFRSGSARRLAAVSGVGFDGGAAHVVLSEGTPPAREAASLLRRSRVRLVPVCADDPAALAARLEQLAQRLESGAQLDPVVADQFAELAEVGRELRVVLVGHSGADVAREARLAVDGARNALARGEVWQTPQGSSFVPQPLGEVPGVVSFVYPGAFSAYPGLGDDLYQLFPALHEHLAERVSDPLAATGERRVRPRWQSVPGDVERDTAKAALRASPVAMILAGTAYSLATTAVLEEWFGLVPDSALGFSMGEASMLWALGVWRAGDEAHRRLSRSSLFSTRLVGPCEEVAERVPGRWASAVVRAPVEDIERAVADEPNVWLTHVHTPAEVVLGGAAENVRRVAERSGVEWFPAPLAAAIHCEAMSSAHDDLVELNRLPVVGTPPVRFYTAARYAPTVLDEETLARNLAHAVCRRMDFPRLVEQAWQDGARVFVELGPGAACSRWVGEILAGRPHAAVSVDARGVDDATALVRAVARLVAEHVPLRLDALMPEREDPAAEGRARVIREVSLCGSDLVPFMGETGIEPRRSGVVMDEQGLLAFAGGAISDAFGPDYAEIDGYPRRVRLPLPPYLLVSSVTELDAVRGKFDPCTVTTEYDVPHGAWYVVDGQVPLAVAVESGQCDLLLISYLGIDFECRGDRVYRLLDCALTFVDELPKEGDTLRYEIRIDSFTRSGDTLLFFFSYDCYVGARRVLEMRDGCAGFFSDEELASARGVVDGRDYLARRAAAVRSEFSPPLTCERRSFDLADVLRLGNGELGAVFGHAHDRRGLNPSLRLPDGPMRMIDRVVEVDPTGGAWGIGTIVAEKDLAPDDWYFPCHFKGDEVLAGSLMSDGCMQLLQLYLLFLGLHTRTTDARFQPASGVTHRVVCRGQVTPETRRLRYRLEVTALEDGPRPFARANCDIVVGDLVVVRFTDLALELVEKQPVAPLALYDERQIREFTLGSVAACFGPEFAIYDGRRAPRNPNGDLQLLSRVLDASPRADSPTPGGWIVAEYDVPPDPWFSRQSSFPAAAPYSVLMEVGLQPCGFLSAHQGSSLLLPDADLYFRNLDGSGCIHREVDLRGRTVRVRAELTASASLADVILQEFVYEVTCEGELIFEGTASFGYFERSALAQQVGLDRGEAAPTWLDGVAEEPEWLSLDVASPLLQAEDGRPFERLPGPQLHFLDRVAVVPDGGLHRLGYVYGEKTVDFTSWFFPCHFHLDPVMPGSLGVEAVIEALQCFALRTGLTRDFDSPRFGHLPGVRTSWKYRGQIVEGVERMKVEAHITRIEQHASGLVLHASGSLWRDELRIYEIGEIALLITEALPGSDEPMIASAGDPRTVAPA
jgi:PfaB family protein